jgi:hypothetical protein
MNKTNIYKDLGIPKQLQIAGRTVYIKLHTDTLIQTIDPKTGLKHFDGYYGKSSPKDSTIHLSIGNDQVKIPRDFIIYTLIEELNHMIFLISGYKNEYGNEPLVKGTASLWHQVLKQLDVFKD